MLSGLINTLYTITRHKMFFLSHFTRYIDHFTPCVLWYLYMFEYTFMVMPVTSTYMYTNIIFLIDVLVVVQDKIWKNSVMIPSHTIYVPSN